MIVYVGAAALLGLPEPAMVLARWRRSPAEPRP
jgi:hypothetical protein